MIPTSQPRDPSRRDDHLLRDLLADDVSRELERVLTDHESATTNLYLYRLSRSVVSAPGGSLTGAWGIERRRGAWRTPNSAARRRQGHAHPPPRLPHG